MIKPNKSFKDFLKEGKVILFDGAMATLLYDSGIFFNKCYEETNITQPDLIEKIYSSYIEAGAQVIEANTFGANPLKLKKYGLEDKIDEIISEGIRLARKAAGDKAYIAGSIGPLGEIISPRGELSVVEGKKAFQKQIEVLEENSVDLFILETFRDINELLLAVETVREISSLPIIASLSFTEDGLTFYGETIQEIVKKLNQSAADVIGTNCSLGPKPMLEIASRIVQFSEKPVSVMPNSGYPQTVNDRLFYATSPEYFAEYSKRFVEIGAQVVGGCCGSTPEHIKEMKKMLTVLCKYCTPQSVILTETHDDDEKEISTIGFEEIAVEDRSPLGSKLGKEYIISVEISPPRGSDLTKIIHTVEYLKQNGINLINIPDSPRASARMSPLAMASILERDCGIETIWHYTCRDKSLIGIQSDFLGAAAAKLNNVLLVTGDPPKLGDYPYSTGVFDSDAAGLVKITTNLNKGMDLAGNLLKNQTSFVIGVGANPAAVNFDEEIRKTIKKIENGAHFILTQPVYDLIQFQKFMKAIHSYNIPVLIGILPLMSYKMAEFLQNEVPGVEVPSEIREKLFQADDKEHAKEIGLELAKKIMAETKSYTQGAYIMMPLGNYKKAIDILS